MEKGRESATVAYIRHVLEEMRISPSALAKNTGISSTTLTRPLNNPEHKFNLSATTIEKIANYSGISPAPFFDNKDFVSRSLAEIHKQSRNELLPQDSLPPPHDAEHSGIKSAIILGGIGLGLWQEVGKAYASIVESIPLTSVYHRYEDCFVVIVADDHVYDHAYIGDYLFCIKYQANQHRLSSGDTVILERRKDAGRLIELTARRLQKTKNGWRLYTMNRDRHGVVDEVFLSDMPGDGDAVVVGVAQYVVKPIRG